jgi:probable HAF family extracellular repeat protein
VVGVADNAPNQARAFRWENGTMQNLGAFGGTYSVARAVSADGSVVTGMAYNASNRFYAFRWANGTMQNLGTLSNGDRSMAYGVSADGSVVVGSAFNGYWHACRWENGTIRNLNNFYANLLQGGSYLYEARAISMDGRYIVGGGVHVATERRAEAYLLDTRCDAHDGDVDGNGCIDDADLLAVLFAFGTTEGVSRTDVNCNGTVDDTDLLLVLFNFGQGC